MRRAAAISLLILLIFVLGACNSFKSNTISVVELTERENAILSTTSVNAFIFDFNTDGDFREASAWIEKYEAGQLVEDKISHITTGIEQSGSIIFATSTNNEKEISFNIGIGSNGGVASIKGFDPNSSGLDNLASIWESINGEKTLGEGDKVLASICYANSEIRSFTEDFYEDTENHLDELNRCDVAYLLKVEFMK